VELGISLSEYRNEAYLTRILVSLSVMVLPAFAQAPSINPAGVVPLYASVNKIQPGEWISIFGSNPCEHDSHMVWQLPDFTWRNQRQNKRQGSLPLVCESGAN
jgi:hypothetical protein